MSTTATQERKIIIEQRKRLSDSLLWKLQREYFEQQGINAWVNQVPFYITSNPYIGTCYAQIIARFICEWADKHPDAKNHPFYILELGTGSGRFSYYTMKVLHELLNELGRSDLKICYIMSDFTENNIKYHETHPALMPYIEKGQVDFAIYDMETDKPITLLRKKIRLSQETLVNPLVVCANYIFDTVSHDAFTVHDEKLYELLLDLSTEEDNLENNTPKDMEKIKVDYNVHELHTTHYYKDPELDPLLEFYKTHFKDTSFLIPLGSLHALKLLRKLSNDKLLVLSTDKGYGELENLENLGPPHIAFHGSFSLMVNFHAIGKYFKNAGGDAFLQSSRKGIKSGVFCSGFKLSDMPETNLAVSEWIEGFSPADYFNMHRYISENADNCDLDTMAAHLLLSKWDPQIYMRMSNRISTLVNEGDSDTIKALTIGMPKIAANYYYMPKSECVLFEVGIFFHAIKQYAKALEYYVQAKPFVGEQFGLFYNIALCLHHTEKNKDALEHFKKSKELDPESKEAQEWINYLEKIIAEHRDSKDRIKGIQGETRT